MELCKSLNELCAAVGPRKVNYRTDVKIEERWKNDEMARKNIIGSNDYYTMGQSLTLKNVPDVIDYMVIRDFPDLQKYNGKKRLGCIFVPDSYIPAAPNMVYVDQDRPKAERSKGDYDKAIGDLAERSTYEVLKSIFTHKKFKGSVLVIQGLNLLQIDPQKRLKKHDRELDFIVVYKELSCIINIEVKNYLGKLQRKKVKQQLNENQQFFEDWFGADISSKWTWHSMVYSEKAFPGGIERCNVCDKYIATGKVDLKEKLLKILSNSQINTPVSEFKLICKYLLFCSPAKPLPIGQASH